MYPFMNSDNIDLRQLNVAETKKQPENMEAE